MFGVDPGLTRCGVGVVEGPPGRPIAVGTEVIRSDRALPIERRLAHLHVELTRSIARFEPDVVACERVLFSSNARTAMGVGQAAGVALLAAAQAGIAVTSYSPNDVKLAVAGHGGADKDAVGRMVAAQLRLASVPRPADVADALAVALCHLGRARLSAPAGDGTAGTAGSAGTAGTAGTAGAAPGSGSWEDLIDANPHVRIAGGSSP